MIVSMATVSEFQFLSIVRFRLSASAIVVASCQETSTDTSHYRHHRISFITTLDVSNGFAMRDNRTIQWHISGRAGIGPADLVCLFQDNVQFYTDLLNFKRNASFVIRTRVVSLPSQPRSKFTNDLMTILRQFLDS